MDRFKMTKIACTLGPVSESEEIITRLVEEGMNIARLNFSHGTHDEHKARIEMVSKIREKLNIPVAIMLDTKGPEIRTKDLKVEPINLVGGNKFILTVDQNFIGDENKVAITYLDLVKEVQVGQSILLDDGLIELKVEKVIGDEIHTLIMNSGELKNKKGVNLPGCKINLPSITEKDKEDILFGIKMDVDCVAASFVRKRSDVIELRKFLDDNDGKNIEIISKIENREGLDNLDEILEASYGIMVARGDLGIEIPAEEIPIAQKEMIRKANVTGKVVITATQMLDSMIRNPRPTRAEVTDVANAVLDGTDVVMLSGETAAGKYPVEAVRTMKNICITTEKTINYDKVIELRDKKSELIHDMTYQVCKSTCDTANQIKLKAIIASTATGFTATRLSTFRPNCPIIAVTLTKHAKRKLCFNWGIYPILGKACSSNSALINNSIEESILKGYVKNGDLVALNAGVPVGVGLRTNFMKIHVVGQQVF